jgi:adenylate kinase
MRCVLLGPPGAGKGSLAGVLKETGIVHISTGDMLRMEIKTGSKLGLEIKGLIEKGSLVSDELITKLVEQKLTTDSDLIKGYMLDGFPRTVHQAQDLDKILAKVNQPLDFALCMDTSIETILMRLSGRRVCRKCGAIFHVTRNPTKVLNVCDVCQGEVYQRSDDNEETIRKRMDIYETSTKPIIDYYATQGKLISISGEKDPADILNDLNKMLNENKSNQDQKSTRN